LGKAQRAKHKILGNMAIILKTANPQITQIFRGLLASFTSSERWADNPKVACCLIGGNRRNLRTTKFCCNKTTTVIKYYSISS
jgi:hypothetical protein